MSTYSDMLKTFFEGALGGISFGIYHQFVTDRIMNINNKEWDRKIEQIRNEDLPKIISRSPNLPKTFH